MLAEKVETHAQLAASRDMGFEPFQGYMLCEPQVVRGRTMAPANVERLRLISDLLDPALEFEELERIIGRDVALSRSSCATSTPPCSASGAPWAPCAMPSPCSASRPSAAG